MSLDSVVLLFPCGHMGSMMPSSGMEQLRIDNQLTKYYAVYTVFLKNKLNGFIPL